jgi:hypothetical protein
VHADLAGDETVSSWVIGFLETLIERASIKMAMNVTCPGLTIEQHSEVHPSDEERSLNMYESDLVAVSCSIRPRFIMLKRGCPIDANDAPPMTSGYSDTREFIEMLGRER